MSDGRKEEAEGREAPKLVSKKKVALMIFAIAVGSCLGIVREWRATGTVSRLALGSSLFAFLIGLAIVFGVTWYANKPEA